MGARVGALSFEAQESVIRGRGSKGRGGCGPERRSRFEAADVTQRRLIAKLVLSCAGADCASLAIAHSHVNAGVFNIERRRTRMAARAPLRVSVALM